MTLYPDGYGTTMVTIEQMRAKHGPKMHAEFKRRFFAYIEAKNGLLGVGGGWRSISEISAASAAGKSFHQDQKFASGFVGYAAVDLVTTDGPDANNSHDGVTWAMTADAPQWGLHTFIKVPDEPWHIQCIEMRGWQTWVDAGRPDPKFFTLPTDSVPEPVPPPAIPPEGAVTMFFFVVANAGSSPVPETWLLCDGTQLSHVVDGHAAGVYTSAGAAVVRSAGSDQTAGLIKSCRTMNDCPPEWARTGWEPLWNASRS